MPRLSVACPGCSASLKLPDRSLQGRKVKCPKCQHGFIVRLPESKQERATAAQKPAAQQKPAAPLTGTSPRWIPDEPQPADEPDLPVFPLAGESGPGAAATPNSTNIPPASSAPPAETATESSSSPFDFVADVAAPSTVTESGSSLPIRGRRRRKKSLLPKIITGISTAVVAGAVIGTIIVTQRDGQQDAAPPPPAANAAWEQEKEQLASSNQDAIALSPTDGDPIPLNYLPFTPHLLLHVRPAELWQRDRTFAEFRGTLGDLGLWLKSSIQTMTHFEPEEIEELTFAINFGPRNSQPDIAAVVRLREKSTEGDLFRRFDGQVRPDLEVNVYESGDLCFMLIDLQTFAVASRSLVDSLVAARDYPALAPADLEPLLKASDRQRHITLLFDVTNIDIHRETVLREELWALTDKFVVWLGKQVDSVSWSLHLQPHLYVETLLRQSNESSPLKVQRHFRVQLDKLPDQLMELARLMRPGTEGSRQMVGRFPAMMMAFTRATSVDVSGQFVRCVTLLPQHAAANIAAGSLLTWNQSVVTNFDTAVALEPTEQLPDTVAERLELPVLVDFRNTPLQEVVASISDEIKTEFVINGDGLKNAGFTQNMPQSHKMGSVSAKAALHAILLQYAEERDPMVICVDEANKRITLTTVSQAEKDGMTVFDTSP